MIEVRVKQKLGRICLDVDEQIPSTGITAVFGRSGSGKTSFINAVSGLMPLDEGRIVIKERVIFDKNSQINLAVEKRNIGYVFQDARLFPHYSVKGNLLYGVKSGVDEARFSHIVSLLNLGHLLKRVPSDLSGGEKQRVAIARALLSEPDMLLMDEPLASLDLPRKKEVMPFLEKLSQEIRIPILYVTHSLSEILRLADHIILMDEGRVAASGSLEEVWASEVMRPWQAFSEQSSLFEAHVVRHHTEYALTNVSLCDSVDVWVQHTDEAPGTALRLQIRANDVSVALSKPEGTSIRNILPARIENIEFVSTRHGHKNISLLLKLGPDCHLKANITQWALDELRLKEGMNVYAQIKGVSVAQKDMAMKHVTGHI